MSAGRLFAIGVIFALATFAWFALGASVEVRTGQFNERLGDEVSGLWGAPQVQDVPRFSAKADGKPTVLALEASEIAADLALEQRRKGLLWYATYLVDFSAAYTIANPGTATADSAMVFTFPDPAGLYDGFSVKVDGREVPVEYRSGEAHARFEVPAGSRVRVETGYRTNGMDEWSYNPSPNGAGIIRDFALTMTTDFTQIDYPAGGVSPGARERVGDGWRLQWDYESVVSGQRIGLTMPTPLNPGPLVSRITFFAPVSLLFFFAALVLLTATSGVRLHPVHYGFLAAAFFAFHLLLAYLADQIDIGAAFVVASVASVLLVMGYLRKVIGPSRALAEIGASQVLFLVLFSYSFFFEGVTGLAITIGSVLTLAFFMWKTAKVEWESVFVPRHRPPTDAPPAVGAAIVDGPAG